MEDNKKTAPEIRFPGYTDPWEQRKVKDICSISTGKSNTQDKVDDGAYPFYVRSPIIEHSNKYLFDEEAVLTVGDGVGTGKVFHYINGKYDLHQRVYRLYGFANNVDAKYFYQWFSSHFYDRVMSMTAKTSVDSVRLEMIADMMFVAPSFEEQQKIASVLGYVDDLITLHQRKCDELKNYKKGLLQQMFPQPGESFPRVRFPGFTDPWEQRKLNSLMDFSNGFNGSSTLYGTGIPYISVMDILNNDFITYECIRGKVNIDEQTLKRFAVDYGDVLFQRSSENVEDAGSSNVYLGNKTAAFGGFVIRGKKKSEYDGFFIKNLLDSETVRKQITSKAQGAQHINVSQETLSDVIVSIPSIEEQVSIGKLFASINETITLHQRKCDELKLYKKGLLQKMFV